MPPAIPLTRTLRQDRSWLDAALISWLAAVLVSLLLAALLASAPLAAETVDVGLVVDGDSTPGRVLEEHIRQEIDVLFGDEWRIRFAPRHHLSAEWTLEGAEAALETLLADPEVDVVLTLGLISSQRVCCLGELTKPVIATTIIDARLQGLPRDGEVSGVSNLAYVDLPDDTEDQLRAFYSVVPFEKLVVLMSREIAEEMPEVIAQGRREIESLGLDVHFVPVGSSANEALDALDALEKTDGVDAVYLWPLFRLGGEAFVKLARGLVERGLPSFSSVGGDHLEAGILASRREPDLFQRLARRVALDVQRVLLGEDAGQVPVEMRGRPRLTVNLETARALGLEPRWETLLEARLIGDDAPGQGERLDLPGVMQQAVEANLDLRARERAVAAGAQDVETAKAAWRPRASASLLGVVIDDDRAAASLGQRAERTLSAGLEVEQLLYAEGAAANVDIQEASQRGREASFESLRLDIAFEAGLTFLELLRAETLEDVRRNNLELTRSNLEVAELRVEVGAANPSEVYRWQSQIASDRQALIAAAAAVSQARLAVNRLLHRPLETPFDAAPVGLDSPYLMDQDRFRGFIATPKRFRLVRDFSVDRGLELSPDLEALRAALEAQRRRLDAARRAFYLPDVAATFSLDHRVDEAGAGAGASNVLPVESADDTDWSLALGASLELFSGGARRAEVLQAQEEIARLELELDSAEEQTAEAIRAAMIEARASYLSIDLAREAADAARRGQELVADAYARGAVSILGLLDAQNAALNAELAAANAVYDFFLDLLRVERATHRFYILSPPAERRVWLDGLESFFRAEGLEPWRPSLLAEPADEGGAANEDARDTRNGEP